MTSNGKQFTVTHEMLTAVAERAVEDGLMLSQESEPSLCWLGYLACTIAIVFNFWSVTRNYHVIYCSHF